MLIFFLVLIGVFGLSLILGGLMLVFKRLGSLTFIVQILFLGIGFSTIEDLPEVLSNIFLSLPSEEEIKEIFEPIKGKGHFDKIMNIVDFAMLNNIKSIRFSPIIKKDLF